MTQVLPARVTLVGAGPGDPECLTLKAVRAIEMADVLLVDDLVSEAVLQYARTDARVVYVGKRGGCASTPQAFIDRLMVQQARQGLRVVRLKGGDPFVFGRAGEEIESLRAHGIEVEVINGITAGLAAATALQTSLTHRQHAHGVVFITGHGSPGQPATDWPLLARTAHVLRLTLVIYMGITRVAELQRGLCSGLAPNTPVAIVQHASQPEQRHVVVPLDGLTAAVDRHGLGSPSIIIVGDVLRGLAEIAHHGRAAGPAQQRHAA